MRKRAIFGGTFNPIHWGHLLIAEAAYDQQALQEILWLPIRQPSHKATVSLSDWGHRLEMVRRAIASHDHFRLAEDDSPADEPSYAIDRFLQLKQQYPASHWFWIIGADAFQRLPHWYRRQDLVPQCQWLVAPRLGWDRGWAGATNPPWNAPSLTLHQLCEQTAAALATEAIAIQWHLLDSPLVDISSRLIRHYCHHHRSIRYLVPEPVREYIATYRLYAPVDSQSAIDPPTATHSDSNGIA